jgi:DNA (cytosine-5)-methyltransferase 1
VPKFTPQMTLFELDSPEPTQEDWHEQMLTALGVAPGPGWPDRFGQRLRAWLVSHGHRPIRTLSLFSGGGGLDIAFHDAGFDVLEMVEIEPRFAATLKANAREGGMLGRGVVQCIDIREYEPPPELTVDFIIGGPPCQTFSAAGRRAAGVKGTSDPRGTLFEEYVRLLERLRPCGFLFENVYGITGADSGDPWRAIQEAFRAAGYVIQHRVLDAADYGAPQHRERLFIVGIRSDHAVDTYLFPCPTHGPDAPKPRPFYTAGEAVRGADPTDETSLLMRGRWGRLIPGIPPGLNYSYYTREMGHPTPVFAWRSKFSDFMYKADPDSPVRTVKAQGGAYTGPFSWENRHFSTAEMKRLQTFPDEYEVIGKRQARIHQLGNSVPPQIGRILALSILDQLFGASLPFPMHYLAEHKILGFRTRKRALTEQYAEKARAAIAALSHEPRSGDTAIILPAAEVRYITDQFALVDDDIRGGLPICLRYEGDCGAVVIWGEPVEGQTESADFTYTVRVEPTLGTDWPIPLKAATLRGVGQEHKLLTALWKALEELIAEQHGVDDLVQLSGYYQYTPKVRARMEIQSNDLIPNDWYILCKVVGGDGVAIQLPVATLAELWSVPQDSVLPALHSLRAMGYEVRSHNTNPQIAVGEYLIPYAFPTLTPRSVQLRKKL